MLHCVHGVGIHTQHSSEQQQSRQSVLPLEPLTLQQPVLCLSDLHLLHPNPTKGRGFSRAAAQAPLEYLAEGRNLLIVVWRSVAEMLVQLTFIAAADFEEGLSP